MYGTQYTNNSGTVQFQIPAATDFWVILEAEGWETRDQVLPGIIANATYVLVVMSPNGRLISRFRGVDIFLDLGIDGYLFYFNGNFYGPYSGVDQAMGAIDQLLGPPFVGPPEPTPPVIQPPTPPTQGTAPAGLSWLQGVFDWFGGVMKWLADTVSTPISGLGSTVGLLASSLGIQLGEQSKAQNGINAGLALVGERVASGLTAKTSEIIQKSLSEALNSIQIAIPGAVGNSPAWKVQIDQVLTPYANDIVGAILAEVSPDKFAHSPITHEEAKSALSLMLGGVVALEIGVFVANAALEAATFGQVEAIKEIEALVLSKLGLSTMANNAVNIPLTELVYKKAQQSYAAEYVPEIPNYSDLINMRVKEKITQPAFVQNLAYLGYSKEWADLIWDAHFQAPGLNDILTAWRRGEITEQRVDELMILVDLDPFYKQVFDTRKYVDPSLSLARFMFETGSINEAQVRDIVHRNGFRPDDTERLTDFVLHFQERRYRQRYITALATGYTRGVVAKDELSKSVIDAGYTQGTADWIVKSADIRKDIASRGTKTAGPKLLALGDLKKAYVANLIDEDNLRTELQMRDYQTADIQTLIEVLNLDKAETVEGRKVVALNVSEMFNAFKYEVWSEDELRTALMVRGLALDEVNTLIETKKRSWGVAGP
jgi:hypothetical protein